MCLALILVAGSCTNPRVQANIAQALNDVGNELTAQRQDMSTLQEQIDSLKQAMAHQDTIIKRLINVTGIPTVTVTTIHDENRHRVLHGLKLRTAGHQSGGRASHDVS